MTISLINKYQTTHESFIYRFTYPENFTFQPGQYVFLTNPQSVTPDEKHPFSVASSSLSRDYLEFCIKINGDWTKEFTSLSLNQEVKISNPFGSMTWDNSISHAAFLIGSVGIAPVISMFRTIALSSLKPQSLTLFLGNLKPETVSYKKELEDLTHLLPQLRIINIYSEIDEKTQILPNEYKGFISKEIVEKELDLSLKPTFYYIGQPIFVEKMEELLDSLHLPLIQRRKEDFSAVSVD